MPKVSFRDLAPQVMLAPMVTFSSRPDGHIGPEEVPYLEARARGGFDWIITGACCVHPSGWAFKGQWLITGAEFVPSICQAAEAVRRGGSRPILQIHHGGRQAPAAMCGGPVSASAVSSEHKNAETPRALSISEIEEIEGAFVQAARFAEEAGFEGVELHGANTYLLQQFVSPHSNRRDDAYGKDRLRFSEEIVRGVVEAVGSRMIVGYRFSPEESEAPGIRMADTCALLDRLAPLGLDYVHISLKRFDQRSVHRESRLPVLKLVADHLAGCVPLIGVGEIKTWDDRDRALEMGAHSIAVGRMGVLNPDWPRRAKEGIPLRFAAPYENVEESLTVPPGLADKILHGGGWFLVEPRPEPAGAST